MKLCRKVKKYMVQNKLKGLDVAKELGIHYMHLSAVVNDRRRMTPNFIKNISAYIKRHVNTVEKEHQRFKKEVSDLLQQMDDELK